MKPPRALPALTRRVALAVLGAFVAVFILLFAVIWRQSMAPEHGDMDRITRHLAQLLARTLDDIDSEDAVRMALALMKGQLSGSDNAAQPEPPMLVLAQRRDGSLRVASPELPSALAAQAVAMAAEGRRVYLAEGGRELRGYTAVSERWAVTMFDESTQRGRWLGWTLLLDLGLYIGMALPVVLLPVWWMSRAALRPLQALSDEVGARAPLAQTPLATPRRWRELAPLIDALNQLFARIGHGIAREKAFVHDAAHELRTPLAVIATEAHVLAAHAPGADAARLMAAVQRASHLTQQLLQMARADAPLSETTQVDLMDLLRDAMSLHADTAAAQGSELELAGPDQLVLPANERLLRSIADNLLDNALRYGGTGSRVHVSVALEGQVAVLEVRDSGPGIAAEHHERVFERFWRPPGQPQPGSGLGLAIVREAARALGGDAHVLRQAPGSGAALQVRLPLSTSARARAVP